MSRATEWALAVLAAALAGAFIAGIVGGGTGPGGGGPADRTGRYFHGGKMSPPATGGGCRSAKCHDAAPHARNSTLAAFRNMHVRFVECMVCHGRNPRSTWTAKAPAQVPGQAAGGRAPARERWTMAAPAAAGAGNPHDLLGDPVSCRACHSEEGRRDIAAAGAGDLPPGFANPLAVRMVEEGGKQWIPDTMR